MWLTFRCRICQTAVLRRDNPLQNNNAKNKLYPSFARVAEKLEGNGLLTSEHLDSTSEHRITVRPNASLSQRGAYLFFAGIFVVSLTIALRFFVLGAWLILPFALIELGVLAFCLGLVLKSNQRMESIYIKDDGVTLILRDKNSESRLDFHRYWVQLVTEVSGTGKFISEWHPMRLLLRSHGRSVEIGSFINYKEKKQLEEQLRNALLQRS